MKRSRLKPGKPLVRRTPLVSSGAPKRRKRLNPVSAKKRREIRESRPVVSAVVAVVAFCAAVVLVALATSPVPVGVGVIGFFAGGLWIARLGMKAGDT